MLAHVVRDVLDAEERGLGAPELAPLGDPGHHAVLEVDAPEEVVRREEDEAAAAVAEALDRVVLGGRHVLVVAGEDERVVGPAERRRVADGVELGLGQDVDLLARPAQPVQEVEVVAPEVGRDAAVRKGR